MKEITDLQNKLKRKKRQFKIIGNISFLITGIFIVFSLWYIFSGVNQNINHFLINNIFYTGIIGIFILTIQRIKCNYDIYMIIQDIKYQELIDELNNVREKILAKQLELKKQLLCQEK